MEKIKKRYLNDRELAEMTGLSVQTFRNWRHQGRGPAYIKLYRSVLYDIDETLKYFQKHQIQACDR